MGISGLLPLLKPVTKDNHISSYSHRRIAIDGYAWLHKAVYGCCVELAEPNATTDVAVGHDRAARSVRRLCPDGAERGL